jgi:beta-lactam-binding protein with PASTA domain/tRNA A-37 threonylcarbamoyl transferase component Bud32
VVVSRSTDQVGRVLSGRYRLIAPIGTGASAQVFLADDVRLKRRVAVKVLHEALADDESFLRRFRAEAQAAAALNHPNILAVYDWGDDGGSPYLVTEYLSGGSLRDLFDQGLRCTTSQALLLGLQATRALDYAHRRGFVHRDVKPANLLFGDDGRLRIADFGLARALAEAAWTEPQGAVLGTARYASPEQAQGQGVDGRADVYSLGLVLIESVTGQVPFTADTTIGTLMARVGKPVDVPSSLGPLGRILERVGQPDPADRPDAGELGVSLMAIAGDLPRPEPLPLITSDLGAVLGESPSGDHTLHGSVPRRAADEPTRLAQPGEEGDLTVADGVPAVGGMVLLEPDEVEGYRPPRRRRRWPWVIAMLLFASGLGIGGAWAYGNFAVPSYEVPVVTSHTEAEARAIIQDEDHGWSVDVEHVREDGSVAGSVIRQDPEVGEELKRGKTITLFVSDGNTLADLPTDLAGKPFAEAEQSLIAAGFRAKRIDHPSEDVPKDIVLGLTTDPGAEPPTRLPKDSEVPLDVSSGPAPRTVPGDLGDGSYEQAAAAIEAQQLVAKKVEVFHDTVPAGKVVGTSPSGGTEVPRDSEVTVQVSKGPDVVKVPNVKGLTLPQAIAKLEAEGLTVGDVFGPAKGQPFTTSPDAGTQVKRGTTVDIYLK